MLRFLSRLQRFFSFYLWFNCYDYTILPLFTSDSLILLYNSNNKNHFNVKICIFLFFLSLLLTHTGIESVMPSACLMTGWCSLKDRGHLLAAGGPRIFRIPSKDHNSLLFNFVFQSVVLRSAWSCERLFSQRAVCPESRIASLC